MKYNGHPDQYWGCISYSQHGEDLMLLNIFKQLGIEKPNYLDLGAHHPITISTTHLLYERGSRGVNVEVNPNLIDEFLNFRPKDITVNVAIGLEENLPCEFYMFSATSGRNTCSAIEAIKFAKESGMEIRETLQVYTKTMKQIVNEYCNGQFPEFLNCDIEGYDYSILKNADFSKSHPVVICVETRINETHRMTNMMKEQNFSPYCRMGENIIFIHGNYVGSLNHLIGK